MNVKLEAIIKLRKKSAITTVLVGLLLVVFLVMTIAYEITTGSEVNRSAIEFIIQLGLAGFCLVFGWTLGLSQAEEKLGEEK